MIEIDDLENDLLTELINQGIGRAAASLSLMVEEEVKLTVPELKFITFDETVLYITENNQLTLSGVQQTFDGDISGSAFLIFSDTNSLDLVRIILGKSALASQLTEYEADALNEIGNVILNAAIGSMANNFGNEIIISLPKYIHGDSNDVFKKAINQPKNTDLIMLIKVKLSLVEKNIQGHVLLLFDIESMSRLKESLQLYLKKIGL